MLSGLENFSGEVAFGLRKRMRRGRERWDGGYVGFGFAKALGCEKVLRSEAAGRMEEQAEL